MSKLKLAHPLLNLPRLSIMNKPIVTLLAGLICALLLSACQPVSQSQPIALAEVQHLQGFPQDDSRFAQGVSACFAGLSKSHLILAGGCNFPHTPAAEGGAKVYYRAIYATPISADTILSWKRVGELPQPTAYGISLTTPDGVLCIGGMNEQGRLNSVCHLQLNEGEISCDTLPALPCTLDNSTGAMKENRVYVAGGNCDGVPSNACYTLDLSHPESGWERLPDFPGHPRTQAVSGMLTDASGEQCFAIWGGFAGAGDERPASLSTDGYAYHPDTGEWSPLPAPIGQDGDTISLGGGTAVTLNDSLLIALGGVHKDIFLNALRHPAPDYLTHPAEWYQFNKRLLLYNAHQQQWSELGAASESARAGSVSLHDGTGTLIINGELKPGIRTPEISRILLNLPN